MKYILILIVLISCSRHEEEIKKPCYINPFYMTISDSIPVQFWVNGVQTFNQKEICGVYSACFCLPFQCDDEITIQFEDIPGSSFQLVIFNSTNSFVNSIPFIEISSGIYNLTFTPGDSPETCETIALGIYDGDYEPTANEYFESDLGDYVLFGSGIDWVWSGNESGSLALLALNDTDPNSKYIRRPLDINTGDIITISLTGEILDNFGGFATLKVFVFDGATPVDTNISIETITNSTFSLSASYTALSNYTHIGLYLDNSDGLSTQDFYINEILISVSRDALAQSDCIDLKESHDCTVLLQYTNSSDFDNITYDISPQPTFYLRVPAQFWKEENPQEQEDLELSNGRIVTLRQSIQEKRLLELGFLPNYLHKKIQKILMHDTVIIDGDQWKKRDGYEAENIDRYPLKRGSVLLTKYDSVEKNTI